MTADNNTTAAVIPENAASATCKVTFAATPMAGDRGPLAAAGRGAMAAAWTRDGIADVDGFGLLADTGIKGELRITHLQYAQTSHKGPYGYPVHAERAGADAGQLHFNKPVPVAYPERSNVGIGTRWDVIENGSAGSCS